MDEVVVAAAEEATDAKVDAVAGVKEEEEEGEGGPHHHHQQRRVGPTVTKVPKQMMVCHSEITASTQSLPTLHSGPSKMLE